jgi:hypothetical protein
MSCQLKLFNNISEIFYAPEEKKNEIKLVFLKESVKVKISSSFTTCPCCLIDKGKVLVPNFYLDSFKGNLVCSDCRNGFGKNHLQEEIPIKKSVDSNGVNVFTDKFGVNVLELSREDVLVLAEAFNKQEVSDEYLVRLKAECEHSDRCCHSVCFNGCLNKPIV